MQINDRSEQIINDKVENLIAIGAAVATNCIPCFEHLYEKAIHSGSTIAEIQRVSEIAGQVKSGAHIALKNFMNEVIGTGETQDALCSKSENKPCCC